MKFKYGIWGIFLLLQLACNKAENIAPVVLDLQVDVEEQIQKLSYVKNLVEFKETAILDGLKLYSVSIQNQTDAPLAFHLIAMDRAKANLKLKTISLTKDSSDYELGTVKEMATQSPYASKIQFAVNGDFFYWQGNPWGPFVQEGRIIHDKFFDTWHSFFAVKKTGEFLIGGNLNYAKLKDSIAEGIGGVEKLMSDYAMVSHANSERHPRTSLGFNAEKFYLLVVDGRKAEHSIGMSFREMSELFFSLKVQHALNLDGGGSSTLIQKEGTGFREINVYSDAEPRKVANGLAIVVD